MFKGILNRKQRQGQKANQTTNIPFEEKTFVKNELDELLKQPHKSKSSEYHKHFLY